MKKRPKDNSNGFDEWGGYMSAKKSKLEEQFEIEAGSCKREGLFQGVAIFVNGYTIPSAEELKALMLLHGGIYHHYESSRTTHIIASNLPHTKMKKLKPGDKIVKPEWITDSIASGKLLDYTKYLFFTANVKKTISKVFQTAYSITSSSSVAKKLEVKCSTTLNQTKASELEGVNPHPTTSVSCTSNLLDICVEHSGHKKLADKLSKDNFLDTRDDIDSSPEEWFLKKGDEVNTDSTSKTEKSKLGNSGDTSSNEKQMNFHSTKEVNINTSAIKQGPSKTASDTQFLSEFYSNSRLHHLSTMGAMFKQYVSELREKHTGRFSGLESLQAWKESLNIGSNTHEDFDYCGNSFSESVIMHIDMDCFFVSVGTRNHPELRDQPVAVAHGKGNKSVVREGVDRQAEFDIYRQRTMSRMGLNSENHTRFNKVNSIGEFDSMSEISSCNYKAREFGVKNGMFVGGALKKCPGLKIVPYDFEGYKEVSYILYNLLASLTVNIEAVSCDEMYVDCTQLLQQVGLSSLQFASYLRQKISDETGCTCSTGFGSNKLRARLATKKAKPNGEFHLTSELITQFIQNIPLSDLPGVGHSLIYKLNSLGATTCGDLQKISLKTLQNEFGNKSGMTLYKHCRGEDDKELNFDHQRKSVSAEVNYGIRFQNNKEMDFFLNQLSTEVEKRLAEVKMKGKCITVKLMVRSAEAPREASKFLGHGVCDYITKSSSLPLYISQANQILREVMAIVAKLQIDPTELRGIGIQVSKLELQSKTIPTIDTFFKSRNLDIEAQSKPLAPPVEDLLKVKQDEQPETFGTDNFNSTSSDMCSPKKLIFVTDIQSKSPKRKTIRSPKKKSPKKIGDMKKYLIKAEAFTQEVPDDFDRSVFDTLPEDVKREVLRSTKQQLNILKPSKQSTEACTISNAPHVELDSSFLDALPEDIREEVIQDFVRHKTEQLHDSAKTPPNSSPCLSPITTPDPLDCTQSCLLQTNLSLQEMRTMLKEWLGEPEPQSCDVDMFSNYINSLVEEKKLNQIVILMRFLQRNTDHKNCSIWKAAYTTILNGLQTTMRSQYGAPLSI